MEITRNIANMVLESTMICVDNSDFMRNGDFVPTRLQAQQDAVNLICHSKSRSNPENNVGLLTMALPEVLVTLTSDTGRILSRLHAVQPNGDLRFISSVRVAHLALKHRQGKNHKLRIVIFIGSPVEDDDRELVKLAKRLKKEKVNVDVVNFGEESLNTDKLTSFVNTINGKEGTSSHLVTVPPGPLLSDALINSPIVVGEDGTGAVQGGFEFGVDPNDDPELALALRVSMEEQRARQEEESRKVQEQSAVEAGATPMQEDNPEDAVLKQALEMSMQQADSSATTTPVAPPAAVPDFSMMTEDEQIAYALQMSMQNEAAEKAEAATPMETDEEKPKTAKEDEDFSEVISDPEFLQSVLEGLPGVDPQSEAIRNAMGTLTQNRGSDKKDKKEEPKK